MSKWYQKCMPQIKDIKPFLDKTAQTIKQIDGVENVYVWGKYAENINNPNYRIKKIDVIASTNIFSEDLVSVNNDILEKKYSNEELENDGYDPLAIKFSNQLLSLNNNNMEYWTLSNDNKLMHWGPIAFNKKELDEIEKEAENHAIKITGKNTKQINKASENIRKNWYSYYKNYKNSIFYDMPDGWYQLECNNLKNIIKLI